MAITDGHAIRIAMLGMVEGNGHPYSWSAIINGDYDETVMENCGYPAIPAYLGAAPRTALGIPGARVTHVWCDAPEDATRVAQAARIPHVAARPEDVIGEVDAVIIATDIGHEHVHRAKPFIDAGVPVFIDKPLTDRADHLKMFIEWAEAGRLFMSTSCMRYAREFRALRDRLDTIGDLRLITVTMAKCWERYGIHAIEAIYPFLRSGGFETVRHHGDRNRNLVHVSHADRADVVLAVVSDLYGAFGCVNVYGTEGSESARFHDTFYAFKSQLEAFVGFVQFGVCPVPFEETVEQIEIVIAGLQSREQHGSVVALRDVRG